MTVATLNAPGARQNVYFHRGTVAGQAFARILQIAEGITANIFHMINSLAIDAVESGRENITDEAIERGEPEFDAEAAFA